VLQAKLVVSYWLKSSIGKLSVRFSEQPITYVALDAESRKYFFLLLKARKEVNTGSPIKLGMTSYCGFPQLL